MSIKLCELVIENFKSYCGSSTLDFKKKQGNLVLIRGIDEIDKSSNGAGKSSIVDAIVFAFFGRSLMKELNLDDLVCNRSSNPLLIRLTFEDSADGSVKTKYTIERTRSKSPAVSKLSFYINDECVSNKCTNTEVQGKIEAIIGMDYQMFVNNNVLNPELFRFVKGSSAQKIDILERVLNLNIVAKIFNLLATTSKKDTEIFQKHDTEYYALKKTLESLKQQEDSVNKNVKENVDLLTQQITSLEEEINKLQEDLKRYELNLPALQETVNKINSDLSLLREEKTTATHIGNEAKKRITFYENNTNCHACDQPLPNRDVALEEAKKEFEAARKRFKEVEPKIEELMKDVSFTEHNSLLNDINAVKQSIREKKNQQEINKRTIARFSNIVDNSGQVEEVTSKLKTTEVDWTESKSNMEITEFWREMLIPKSTTRMSLAGDLLKVLNNNIRKYVNNFYNKDFSLWFTIDDNDINIHISVNGSRFKYDQLSSGERQKVDIVIVLSLLDIAMTYFKNNKLKFLIIDEATDHLDNVWARYVVEFIKQYAIQLNMMCLLISHHSVVEELDNVFDNTIVAVKGQDGSSYIQTT